MKVMKKIILKVFLTLTIIFLSSCSTGNPLTTLTGSVALKATATVNNTALKTGVASKSNGTNTASITISSFKINIDNIEFHRNESESLDSISNDSIYSDTELKGPFELDLASGNTSIDVATVNIPDNIYDKINFELHKSKDANSTIFGKSIEIKGDINGTPFIFWTDAEEEMQVKFSTVSNIVVRKEAQATTTINFNLSTIFGATSTIDFSTAIDGNGDGIIEISPDNNDGNADLAHTLKNLLKEDTDLEND